MNINQMQENIEQAHRLMVEVHEAIKANNGRKMEFRLIGMQVAGARHALTTAVAITAEVQDNA